MDGYYQSQVSLPYYSGAARQRGSGLGSLALSVGRFALPIVKQFLLPTAKRIGKELITNAAPELIDVVSGKQNVRNAAKKAVRKTISQSGSGGGGGGGGMTIKTKRKRSKVIKRKTVAKRSRIDILGNLKN